VDPRTSHTAVCRPASPPAEHPCPRTREALDATLREAHEAALDVILATRDDWALADLDPELAQDLATAQLLAAIKRSDLHEAPTVVP
jgi:5,10-methylenetetrahydrofolate reductase